MNRIILTGVDGSETALKAAETAASLAVALEAELHILSAFSVNLAQIPQSARVTSDPTAMGQAVKTLGDRHMAQAHHIASNAAEKLRKAFPTLTILAKPVEGAPGVALTREAKRVRADLIVVGNKRVQGATRLLGSIARTVASEAPCDLYVVQTHPREHDQR